MWLWSAACSSSDVDVEALDTDLPVEGTSDVPPNDTSEDVPDEPPIEVTDLASYTARCEQLLGPFPTFDCYDGVEVSVTVTSLDGEVTIAQSQGDLEDGWRCDRPSHLQGCVTHARLGTIEGEGGTTWTFVCRSYTEHPLDASGLATFEDLGVIASRPGTGDTCFWAVPIDGRQFDGAHIPRPGSAEDAAFLPDDRSFWYTLPQIAWASCTSCHDNDPYIHTPWAHQTGLVPSRPLDPYVVVAADVLTAMGSAQWQPARTLVHPDAAPCLTCHRLSERFTCGGPVSDAAGDKAAWFGHTAAYTTWPYSHWMESFDPGALSTAWASESAWNDQYAAAVATIQQCCAGADDSSCWSD